MKELTDNELEGITGGSNAENVQIRSAFLKKFGSKMTDADKAKALGATGADLAKNLNEDLNTIPGMKVSISATGSNSYSYNGQSVTFDQFMTAINNLEV